MIDLSVLDELAQKLSAALPPGARDMRDDARQQFRTILQTAFERMDLVTREEFDVQQAVLARTREKLEALEQRVQEWEQRQ